MSIKYKFIVTLIYTLGIFYLLMVLVLGKTYNMPYVKFTKMSLNLNCNFYLDIQL